MTERLRRGARESDEPSGIGRHGAGQDKLSDAGGLSRLLISRTYSIQPLLAGGIGRLWILPNFSYLDTTLECPHCCKRFPYAVAFQWGLCRWQYYEQSWAYRLGDALAWKELADGKAPGWSYFEEEDGSITANLGDRKYSWIVTTDHWFLGEGRNSLTPWMCPLCQQSLWSTAVEIKQNVLVRAWIFNRGDFAEECDYYLVDESGNFSPHPEWEYISMPVIDLKRKHQPGI